MGPSDRVAVEPGGLIGRSRVEPEQALCVCTVLVPVLQQRVELAHGLDPGAGTNVAPGNAFMATPCFCGW